MVAVISEVEIANNSVETVKQVFCDRPRKIDSTQGLLHLEVTYPQDKPTEIWLLVCWISQATYQIWYRNHQYHEAHKLMPNDMELVPDFIETHLFEQTCE